MLLHLPAALCWRLAAIYHEDDVIGALLSFFETFDLYKGSIDPLPRLLITIMRFLVLDSENSPIVDSIGLLGERPHTYTTFIYKHRLLEIYSVRSLEA